jgi:hypothetical protein
MSASATTFLVPTDRKLIASSRAIVIAVAGAPAGRWSTEGSIETATPLRIEESIRGGLRIGQSIEVVETGGLVGEMGLLVSGGARFTPGERVLLFLRLDDRGTWRTTDMVLGKFSFVRADDGRDLLLRDAREICGWDQDGTWHREPYRDAERFLRFVRGTARGENVFADYIVPAPPAARALIPTTDATIVSYLFDSFPARWNTFPSPVVFRSNGSQVGAPAGGLTAVQRGLSVWTNDSGSNVVLQYGGTTSQRCALINCNPDGVHSIVFNDPSNEISGAFPEGSVLAIGGVWIGGGTHQFAGEQFRTVNEADLVVQNGITGRGLTGLGFEHVIAHELGHTLGFRHSDEPHSGGTFSEFALMASTVDFDFDTTGAALQSWDIEALRAVYGSGTAPPPPPPPCQPPAITTQPQSTALTGTSVSLTVQATGTAPLQYQWYEGSRGDTRIPVAGATTIPVLVITPPRTTSYWVRVTGACAPAADSQAATVSVAGCPAVVITSVTQDTSILEATTLTLAVGVNSGGRSVIYQWYAGPRGDTSVPLGTQSTLTVTPMVSTQYWVQVSSDCGAVATTETIDITVRPCTKPRVVLQPSNAEAIFGKSAGLAATISGTGPITLQWYEGLPPDTSRPVTGATTVSVSTPPMSSSTTFWLRASNECGTVDTDAATVTVVATCTPPVITTQPLSHHVQSGLSTVLTVTATGPSLGYRWYQGPAFDFTTPIGGNGPSLATNAINETTEFWVLVENECGLVHSATAIVSTANPRRRAVGR